MKTYLAEHVGIVLLVTVPDNTVMFSTDSVCDVLENKVGDDLKSVEWIPATGSYAITLKANKERLVETALQICRQAFEDLHHDYVTRCEREPDDDDWFCSVDNKDCEWCFARECTHPHPTSLTPLKET